MSTAASPAPALEMAVSLQFARAGSASEWRWGVQAAMDCKRALAVDHLLAKDCSENLSQAILLKIDSSSLAETSPQR